MSHLSLIPRSDRKTLQYAFDDYILSCEARLLSPKTIVWYERTTGAFVEWLLEQGIDEPGLITSRHIRQFLSAQNERDISASTLHGFARGVKAFVRFMEKEGYIDSAPQFDMPRVETERPKVLSPDEVKRLLLACRRGRNEARDRALILVLLDSGMRRGELTQVRWGDVDMKTGTVRIRGECAKTRKFRTVIVGAKARRALLRYQRTVPHDVGDPLFDLTGSGIRQVFRRLRERTGIHATPHDFRRTFATLSLRSGMDLLSLQGLMGHSTLEMTRQYVRLVDEDLQQAHRRHGPVDRWLG